ncbi:MAG: hypothetical protein ACK5QT_06665, partial [Oligoflexia bacterium]
LSDPQRPRSQWITLDRMAVLENRFEAETGVPVAVGESSVLDLGTPRVVPDRPRAITVASMKPILNQLEVSEKKLTQGIQVALERQRRVIPGTITRVAELAELRSPATSEPGAYKKSYQRHEPAEREPKVEKHLAHKLTGGAPSQLLAPKLSIQRRGMANRKVNDVLALERRLEAKADAKFNAEKKRILKELEALERKPASEKE